MLTSFFPALEPNQRDTIDEWVRDYKMIKSNFVKQRDFRDSIKQQIPNTGLEKLRNVFRTFDRGEKGFVTFDDFRESLIATFS